MNSRTYQQCPQERVPKNNRTVSNDTNFNTQGCIRSSFITIGPKGMARVTWRQSGDKQYVNTNSNRNVWERVWWMVQISNRNRVLSTVINCIRRGMLRLSRILMRSLEASYRRIDNRWDQRVHIVTRVTSVITAAGGYNTCYHRNNTLSPSVGRLDYPTPIWNIRCRPRSRAPFIFCCWLLWFTDKRKLFI